MIIGSNLIGFLVALAFFLFVINFVLIKMQKKDVAILLDIIGFSVATIAGMREINSAIDVIKWFAEHARL